MTFIYTVKIIILTISNIDIFYIPYIFNIFVRVKPLPGETLAPFTV